MQWISRWLKPGKDADIDALESQLPNGTLAGKAQSFRFGI